MMSKCSLVCYRNINSQYAFEKKPWSINNTEGSLRDLAHQKESGLINLHSELFDSAWIGARKIHTVNSRKKHPKNGRINSSYRRKKYCVRKFKNIGYREFESQWKIAIIWKIAIRSIWKSEEQLFFFSLKNGQFWGILMPKKWSGVIILGKGDSNAASVK